MRHQTRRFVCLSTLVAGSFLGVWYSTAPAWSQVLPDSTLGTERSIVVPGIQSDRGLIDRIDGGAIRGGNLFHSFSDFNVNTGQRVYFANPSSISNIIGRVTGNTLSNIDGTLGVLGAANLFLINPNGVVFGPNARLDIRGSFTASTAERILFPNGYGFSATTPDAPPLLTVNAPLGLASWLPTSGTVVSSGNLAAGQDLALVGANLNLQGHVSGGRDVSLIATNTLTARDTATTPFIASAANQLLVQGNQSVDIFALNHPNSGLFSGGDMVVRSANPVGGDAHYTAGGSFRVETLNGQPGSLFSPNDPIIRASGDVSFDSYTGASLHILAGGSVTIPGTITITGPEVTDFLAETVTLSNGGTISINGGTQPTLDIRAGTTAFGTAGITGSPAGFTPAAPGTGGTGTSANIEIGDVVNPGGLVFLTNQYQPNPALSGDISGRNISSATGAFAGANGGSVILDSRGQATFTSIDASSGSYTFSSPSDYPTVDPSGNGGDVTLLAKGNIFLPFLSFIASAGGVGGNITLNSATAIIQENAPFGTPAFDLGWIESATLGLGQGGTIRLGAPTISLGGNVFSTTSGDGRGGDIVLTANSLSMYQATVNSFTFAAGNSGNVLVDANSLSVSTSSGLGTNSFPFLSSGGNAGDVTVRAGSITATDGGLIFSFAFGIGNAGNIAVTAQDISLSGFVPKEIAGDIFTPSAIFSSTQAGAEGNSGNITITTGTLSITNAAQVGTTSLGLGDAGDIAINASRSIRVDGAALIDFTPSPTIESSAINSEIRQGGIGRGGDITLTTPVLQVTNGGNITATSDGVGDAGNIAINATQSASFDGVASFASIGQRDRISRAAVIAGQNITGNGGQLTITTPSLSLTNGGQLTAQTDGAGNAGQIKATVRDTVLLDGAGSGILSNTLAGSTGNGGNIVIDPERVVIRNGARIAVDSKGTGTAGEITLRAGSLVLDNRGLISAETVSNQGGNITLNVDDVIVMRRSSRISTSAGTAGAGGDGGNIAINTRFLVAAPTENSDITANAFTGRGGNVNITAEGIFGFRILSRAELQTALGTTDPARLDPIFLPTSDITAISQVNPNLNGTIVIQSPDADPLRGVLPEPPEVVDASRLIARDCSASGAIARKLGSLVVTGQGGLPPSPTDQLRGDALLIGWEPLQRPAATGKPAAIAPTPRSPVQLVEVQTLEKRADGRVVLAAKAATNPEFWSRPTTCPDVPVSP